MQAAIIPPPPAETPPENVVAPTTPPRGIDREQPVIVCRSYYEVVPVIDPVTGKPARNRQIAKVLVHRKEFDINWPYSQQGKNSSAEIRNAWFKEYQKHHVQRCDEVWWKNHLRTRLFINRNPVLAPPPLPPIEMLPAIPPTHALPKPVRPRKRCVWKYVKIPATALVDGRPSVSFSVRAKRLLATASGRPKEVGVWVSTCSVISVPKETAIKSPTAGNTPKYPNNAHYLKVHYVNGAPSLADVRVYLNNVLVLTFFDNWGSGDIGIISGGAPLEPIIYVATAIIAESLYKTDGNIVRLEIVNEIGGGPPPCQITCTGYYIVAGNVAMSISEVVLPTKDFIVFATLLFTATSPSFSK